MIRGDAGPLAEMGSDHGASGADQELLDRVRSGDLSAYGALWARHLPTARRQARRCGARGADVDDVVAEAFAKVLHALRNGGGPTADLGPYLTVAVRSVAIRQRERAARAAPRPDDELDGRVEVDLSAALERDLVLEAFASLPSRWQTVLWHLDADGRRPAEVAPLMGLSPNAVNALAGRAREALRRGYLSAHLASAQERSGECAWASEHLAGHVRSTLTTTQTRRVDDHLEGCARCRAARGHLVDVAAAFRAVAAPFAAGVALSAPSGGALGGSVARHARRLRRMVRLGGQGAATAGVGVVATAAVVAGLAAGGGSREAAAVSPPSPVAAALDPAPTIRPGGAPSPPPGGSALSPSTGAPASGPLPIEPPQAEPSMASPPSGAPAPPPSPVAPPSTSGPPSPREPTEPVEPTEPTEPVEPVEPIEPVEPTEPVEPVEPVEPTEPIEPSEPTETTAEVEVRAAEVSWWGDRAAVVSVTSDDAEVVDVEIRADGLLVALDAATARHCSWVAVVMRCRAPLGPDGRLDLVVGHLGPVRLQVVVRSVAAPHRELAQVEVTLPDGPA